MSDIIFICEICKNSYNTLAGLTNHILKTHKLKAKDYYDTYIGCQKTCLFCNKPTKFKNISFGYRLYCSKVCSSNDAKRRLRKTKQTLQERYSVSNPMELDIVKNKIKETCIKKYGETNYNKTQESKIKHNITYYNKTGYMNPSQNPEVKHKKIQTSLTNYGYEYPLQSQIIKEKIKKTCLEKYGVDNVSKLPDIKLKQQQTCFDRYGVYHALQSLHIKHKSNSLYSYNNITFDSGWELKFYIFLSDLGINFGYQAIKITYLNAETKETYYIPDFILYDFNNLLIEIKGDQFFDKNNNFYSPYDKTEISKENTQLKYKCMIDNNVKLLRHDDLIFCFNYIDIKYGNNYIKQFKNYK